MDNSFIYQFLMPVVLLVLAALAFYSSLKTILQQRPQIHSPRFVVIAMCILFIPIIAHSMMLALSMSETLGLLGWMMPIVYIGILALAWIQMRGYTVEGITDVYFRDALLTSISSLGLTVEESLSRLKIKETGAEIQISMTSWMGSSQLRPLNKQSNADVAQIVDEMGNYFQAHKGQMSYVMPILQLLTAIFMSVMAIWLMLFVGRL